MEPSEGSSTTAVPSSEPGPRAVQQDTSANRQPTVVPAVPAPAVARQQPDAPDSRAQQGTVRAVPLPALRLEHFQTADVSASAAPADAAGPSAVSSSTDLTNFDHAAYAEFQALFDVPAGRSAPYLLLPEKGRSQIHDGAAVGGVGTGVLTVEQPPGVLGAVGREADGTGQLHDDIARLVQRYLQSEAGRTDLARALHQLDGGKPER